MTGRLVVNLTKEEGEMLGGLVAAYRLRSKREGTAYRYSPEEVVRSLIRVAGRGAAEEMAGIRQ